MTEVLEVVDLTLLRWLTPWQPRALDAAMSWVSAAGGAGLIWLVVGVSSLAVARSRAAAWRVLLTVMLAYLLAGNAALTFGGAIAVSRMWPRARVLWWTAALLVGYSRIYLGHHYPLDVVGGALVGTAVAFWVLGGRHPATYANTLPHPWPPGVVVRP